MPDGNPPVTVKAIDTINAVDPADWDACAGRDNPFVSHAFLKACEDSGSAVAQQGWGPQHLVATDESGKVTACAPLYLKGHSYGEYVFDWGWAEAYQRAGGQYYPKLLSAVPFTPATGPRLLVRPGCPDSMYDVLISAMVQLAERSNLSSVHITFPDQAQWQRCGEAGFLLRVGKQFHWENNGYETFDDFLNALSSRKRKGLRKERRAVAESGVVLLALTGSDIKEHHWDAFYDFYMDTADRKWGQPYLTRNFFSLLGELMADKVLLVLAEKDGRTVGGALNLIGSEAIFGRYWGCLEEFKFLHFEACYYMAIDFAIERGLRWVEAGAGGRHKLQRGYLARPTYSAHWIGNESFRRAVEQFLSEERYSVEREIADYDTQSPFRRDDT
jgi:predicted N-acyltransferase